MSFRGNYDYQLDKSRVAIPPRYRDEFNAGIVLTPGVDRCIEVYTIEGYERQAAVLEEVAFESEEGRKARRAFMGQAWDTQKDQAGRFQINAWLIGYAGLKKDVVVVGADRCLEIWDKEVWEAQQPELFTTRQAVLNEIGARKNAQRQNTGEGA